MTRLAAALAVLLLACASSSTRGGHVCEGASTIPPDLPADDAPAFAGFYRGTLTTTRDGVEESQPAVLTIQTAGKNQLTLVDVCLGGVPAVVTGPLAFDAVCYDCLQVATSDCAALSVEYKEGGGSLSSDGATLAVSLGGTAACAGGATAALTQTFSGTRVQTAQAGADRTTASDFAAAAGR